MNASEQQTDRPLLFPSDFVDRLLPFCMAVDETGVIVGVGPSLLRVPGLDDLKGSHIKDRLRICKPRNADPEQLLRDVLDRRITIELIPSEGEEPAVFFGMAADVNWNGRSCVFVALTPGVHARSLIENRGMHFTDFSPVDGSADLLPLLAMQEELVADGKRKTERMKTARDIAEHLANHDALTDLPNRRALMLFLEDALTTGPVAVVHIDLDHFKEINDTLGHASGDAALQHASDKLRNVFTENAICARIGGDEFVAVLTEDLSLETLMNRANSAIAAIAEPFEFAGHVLTVGASVGVSQVTMDEDLNADMALHRADLALYHIKRNARGSVGVCSPDLLDDHAKLQALSKDIRRGLEAEEFCAYMQPQIDIRTGDLIGFEALARWHHPKRDLISPAGFLDAAERAGLMKDLDEQVRRSALSALSYWDAKGLWVPKVSLNVTMQDLVDPNFHETLLWDIEVRGLEPDRIGLEMVESVLYEQGVDTLVDACGNLERAGVSLALDDFGTGHASILSLVDLPMRVVKIDRAFTTGLNADPRRQALIRSMIDMATALGVDVLAEGVNEDEDVFALQEMGCRYFQSYRFGMPMSVVDAADWMNARPALKAVAR